MSGTQSNRISSDSIIFPLPSSTRRKDSVPLRRLNRLTLLVVFDARAADELLLVLSDLNLFHRIQKI